MWLYKPRSVVFALAQAAFAEIRDVFMRGILWATKKDKHGKPHQFDCQKHIGWSSSNQLSGICESV